MRKEWILKDISREVWRWSNYTNTHTHKHYWMALKFSMFNVLWNLNFFLEYFFLFPNHFSSEIIFNNYSMLLCWRQSSWIYHIIYILCIYIFMCLCSVWNIMRIITGCWFTSNDDKNINSIKIKVICYQTTEQRQIAFHLSLFFHLLLFWLVLLLLLLLLLELFDQITLPPSFSYHTLFTIQKTSTDTSNQIEREIKWLISFKCCFCVSLSNYMACYM